MNADQLAEIRPAIHEAIEGAPDTCVTLAVAGANDRWIQVMDHTINAAYPLAGDPGDIMKTLPVIPGLDLSSWVAETFVTFEFLEPDLTPLAEWIDAYFVTVLACAPGDYHLDVSSEKL